MVSAVERVNSGVQRADCHVAVVPSLGLGDSLIYLLVALNLGRAGYSVTLLSNHLAHMDAWLPGIRCLPFPEPENTHRLCEDYDLVISDCGGIVSRMPQEPAWLAERFVFLGTLRVEAACIKDHHLRCVERLGSEKAELLRPLSSCAGPLRVLHDDSVTMVEQAVAFCRTRLGLAEAEPAIGFCLPAHLVARRYPRRVMIHPASYNAKKNWPAEKYLHLARRLRARGYDPQFVLSPKERGEWASLFEPEFTVPHLADTGRLAEYLYESGYVIGNDSGVGHLASALGIPVLTLFRKRRDGFCWRPGWGHNEVVRPILSVGALRNAWTFFLPVGRVDRAFERLVVRHKVGA